MLNDVIGYSSFTTFVGMQDLTQSESILARFFNQIYGICLSVLLGYFIGLLTALLCKFTGSPASRLNRRNNTELESSLYSTDFGVMFLSPWIAYLLAEVFQLSGIVTIFFCGVSLGQYAIYNLSSECRDVP